MRAKYEWLVPLVIAIAGMLLGGWNTYSNTDKELNGRITAVETRQSDDREHLKHIDETVQKIYDKIANW